MDVLSSSHTFAQRFVKVSLNHFAETDVASSVKLVRQGKVFLHYLKGFRAEYATGLPQSKEGDMLCVRDFVNIMVMIVGYMGGKSNSGGVETNGVLRHKVWIVSFISGFKPNDSNYIKNVGVVIPQGRCKV